MQPVGKVDFHSIVTEGSPTFVRVVALVQNVIRIADTGSRPCPVHVCIVGCGVLFQIVQTDIVRNTHQLSDGSVCTEIGAVFCFGAWKWNLSIHRKILVHFHSGIQVKVDSVQFFVREYAFVVWTTKRSTEMWFVCNVTYRYIVVLCEAGIKIIFQFVSVFGESVCVAVPGFLHASVQYRSPAWGVCRIIFRVILRQRILVLVLGHNVSLSIAILHLEGFGYLTPSEVTAIAHSETVFLATFLSSNQNNTVTGTWTVKSGGIRTFQYRNRFDVFGVDIDGRTTAVNTAVVSSIRVIVIAKRHTVYNPEWLVVVSQRRVTTNRDLGRTAKTCTGRVHLQTGYFTLQCTGNRRVSGLVQLVTFDFLYGVSQHFLFTFDT